MKLRLLGPLAVTNNGAELELSGPKRRALLILLALNAGKTVSRDQIIDSLWPSRDTGREESTLRVHVSHLRDVIEPERNGDPRVILTRGPAYMLSNEDVEIDIDVFNRLANEGRSLLASQPELAVDQITTALDLWNGRPLQDVEYEEFAQDDIRRLELARTVAIEDRAEALVELGEDSAAIQDLEALVQSEPTGERPVLLLMRALYRVGRHSDSLRVATRHGRELAEQGLEPSPRVKGLEERILQHDPTLLPEGATYLVDVKPGRSVKGYEIREHVGAGSVGVVYRAYQNSVGREVALKVVHDELSASAEFIRRFSEEAKLVAGLEHPHIVPLHDFWRDPSGAFLVMRWMDGGAMVDRIGRQWDQEDLARVFGQLADALGYAHSAGVVHRDIKSTNVLFDRTDNAYLTDFHLAVTGIDTGVAPGSGLARPDAGYSRFGSEGPTVSSDIHALGVLLFEAASGSTFGSDAAQLGGGLGEVVAVATASDPADRYPDMQAMRLALLDAIGPVRWPAPLKIRRNPYKGLSAFDEADRADFYGRDDMVETLVAAVDAHGLTTVIGASGSGKSSLVKAGLIPELKSGALPGSDEWSFMHMVPGQDPFHEFYVGLVEIAVSSRSVSSERSGRELRDALDAAVGPKNRSVLVIDQFEEIYGSEIDPRTRERFLANVVDLADASRRFRVILTLRADFSDRPLSDPQFGELMSKGSVLVAPMRPEQIEDVIRNPASKVGVQIEPGLIPEVVRDVSSASAYLPLLQYVLSELFERRTEDRLTVASYRSLGGVQGVLERRAEATYNVLSPDSKSACRQLFLRMVQLGDHGETTRRRLPLTELTGLGRNLDTEEALEAFAAARIITYDRDPVTRTPTVEVAHETVIDRWTRFRVWVDEARTDLLNHRRLAAAAGTWLDSDEDPSYLLTGGPLVAAGELKSSDRITLNILETRFVDESKAADEKQRDREEAVEVRSRRRLLLGLGAGAIALLVGVLAVFAFVQRQRASNLAEQQELQSVARGLASASLAGLDSADPELSLLLAVEGAEKSLRADGEILPEVVESLHQAAINPRPNRVIEGAGVNFGEQIISFATGGRYLAMVTQAADAAVLDPATGENLQTIDVGAQPALGVEFHFGGRRVLTFTTDAVQQWDWESGDLVIEIPVSGGVSTAVYSRFGSKIAVGTNDGRVVVFDSGTGEVDMEVKAHHGRVTAIDFNQSGSKVLSGGVDTKARIWDITSGEPLTEAKTETITLPIGDLVWSPGGYVAMVTTAQGETFLFSTSTGERLNSYGNGQHFNNAIAIDSSGALAVAAGVDGVGRVYGVFVGGEAGVELPTGGVPLRDAEFVPGSFDVATVGIDGKVRIWSDIFGSELPVRFTNTLYPRLTASADGNQYLIHSSVLWLNMPAGVPGTLKVIDVASGELVTQRPVARDESGIGRPAISPDGSRVAFAGQGETSAVLSGENRGDIEILDLTDGSWFPLPDTAGWTADLEFNHDGKLLAGAAENGSIGVWDGHSGNPVRTLMGHGDRVPANSSSPAEQRPGVAVSFTSQRVNDLAWHPYDDRLASVGYDGTVRIWDVSSGSDTVLHTFDYEGYSLAYTNDGTRLLASDLTGRVIELDAETGDLLREFESISSSVAIVMSPDGRYMAGAGVGGAVMWDLQTGRVTRRFKDSIFVPSGAAFVQGGKVLLVASGEGMIRGYYTDPLDLLSFAKSKTTRSLTEEECIRYVGVDGCAE